MPIVTEWLDDRHQVIVRRFEAAWSLEEFLDGMSVIEKMAASVPHRVVLYLDMQAIQPVPPGNFVSIGRESINRLPASISHIICVTQSQVIEIFADLVLKFFPSWRRRINFVHTVEEAEQLIADAVAANMAAR